jgi:hypothetical protein
VLPAIWVCALELADVNVPVCKLAPGSQMLEATLGEAGRRRNVRDADGELVVAGDVAHTLPRVD